MEHKLYVVITEDSGIDTIQAAYVLPKLHLSARVEAFESLEQLVPDKVPDLLIASLRETIGLGKLPDTEGTLLLLGSREEAEAQLPFCVKEGILCAAREDFDAVFPLALAYCARLRTLHMRQSSLQRQLTDTKLVNRAKLLLMTRLQMSEGEAHRYIEKTAMDNGEPRRNVALRLIRTYEE